MLILHKKKVCKIGKTCFNRKLLFPLPPFSFSFSFLSHPFPSSHVLPTFFLSLTSSSRDFITKFKFGGMNRSFPFSYISFPLFTFPSASCWIFLLFLGWFPWHFHRLSPNNNIIVNFNIV